MLCPACKDVTLSLADRQGIEIDFCPKCRGVWLDRGELDRIIERSEQTAAPPVPVSPPRQAAGYDERGDKHAYYPQEHHYKRKKKSLLGELFDF
jgi:Zn-finger nucleic acid-binding protein